MDVKSQEREILRAEFRKQQLIELQTIQDNFATLIGDEALPALALAPYWPLELASTSLPISGDVKAALQQAVDDHMVQTGKGPYPWRNDPIFWMEHSTRDSTLQRLLTHRRIDFLKRQLSDCGSRMLSAGGARLRQDLFLFRWAQLASAAESDARFESFLMSEVEKALRESERAEQVASPEALRWIEASESLGEVLRGGFEAAVAAARRRFELFHLHSHDRLKLRNYYRRDDLDRAFLDLLDDSQHWALHYIGLGGTGKTMLIRHLKIQTPSRNTAPANVAFSRVDFDYLNPDYPERNLALLLEALAAEFRLAAGPDSERAFASFQNLCTAIHRKAEGAERQGQERRVSPKDPDFQEALRQFAAALSTLEGRRRPVIILDTCEELVKNQRGSAGSAAGDATDRKDDESSEDARWPRNVRDTFQILRDLHNLVPDLRVIFSGRRPLPDDSYLRVHPIQGFTEREAHDFLEKYRSEDGRGVRTDLIPGIIALARSEQNEARYNPYDLDTYAKWVSADDTLTRERLAAAGPQTYLKERIVDRLNPMVRGILPALAVLGRFDRELLMELITPGSNSAQDLAEVLSQEWMQPDAGTTDTWRLDSLFRDRLLRYYEENDRAASHAVRAQLAKILPEKTLTRPFSQLTPQIFEACLEVLGENPVKAAEWWEKVEDRIAAEAQWPWAADLFEFVEPAPERSGRESLTAALLATRAAASLHATTAQSSTPNLKPDWESVLATAGSHPTIPGQNRLRFRAECALGVSLPAQFPEPLSLQDAASLLAAVEAKIEAGAREDAAMTNALARLEDVSVNDLLAFATVLKARLAALKGDSQEARHSFEAALRTCREGFDARQLWLHWIRPANLEHRILLEFARALPDQFLENSPSLAKEGAGGGSFKPILGFDQALEDSLFRGPLQTIDSDRLASAWLHILEKQRAFSSNPLREKFLLQYESSLARDSDRPRCTAHQEFPPFFVRLLEARAMAGEVEEARMELQRLSQSDLERPEDVTFTIDVAMTRMIRRMRLVSEGLQIPKTLQTSVEPRFVKLARITESFFCIPGNDARDLSGPFGGEDELGIAELAFLRNEPDCPEKAEAAYEAAKARSDDAGCLQARVLHALWFARKGVDARAKKTASEVEPHYREIVKRNSRLPSWDEVIAAAQDGTASTLLTAMNPKPSVWRPWIVRLLACLTPPPRADLLQWLLANDVSIVDGKRYLAAELAFMDTQGAPAAATAAAPRRARFQALKGAATFLLGLAIIAGSVLFLYRMYESGLNTLGIPIGQTWLRIGVFVALLLIVPYAALRIPKLFQVVAKLYANLIHVEFDASYDEAPKDLNRPLGSPGVLRFRTFFRKWLIQDWRKLILAPTEQDAYAVAATEVLRDRKPGSTPAWVRWSFRAPGEAVLILDERSAAAPWEAIQAEATGVPLSRTPVFILRSTRQQKIVAPLAWRAPVEVLTWGAPTVWQSRQDWGVNFRATFATYHREFDRERPDVGIFRIVGDPVESNAGLILRVVSGRPTYLINAQQTARGDSYTIRPGDIIARYPSLRLCIVQLPPGEVRDRLFTDRRDSALLKRIGAEIFSSGVPAVLVVPVLSTEACDQLLDEIAKVIASTPENALVPIERALVSFRRDWVGKFASNPANAEEIAADICLYSRRHVSFKLES